MSHIVKGQPYYLLTIKDLLEAREVHHIFLSNIDRVIGTAVGLYRIRRTDPDAKKWIEDEASFTRPRTKSEKRTLDNTMVKRWSWPCVLVFVKEWVQYKDLKKSPDQLIPRFLHLPDGRTVPTCVIYSPLFPSGPRLSSEVYFPKGIIGGGYLMVTETQGEERIGTLGVLVTDGHTTYGLTNRHVAGEEGKVISSVFAGTPKRIGTVHATVLNKIEFETAYPGWPGKACLINVDAALIRLDSLSMCTSQVYGIGEVGPLVNLHVNNIGLNLIGCPVLAHGGASGKLEGEIQALFYRYKSVGGMDFIADFLIGPRYTDVVGQEKRGLPTRPGDSGAVWFWDQPADEDKPKEKGKEKGAEADTEESIKPAPALRPMALQWGGISLLDENGQGARQFALATSLTTVLRFLDVDLVRNYEIGYSEYWGKVGHYKIALSAGGLVQEPGLVRLLDLNRALISPSDAHIQQGKLPGQDSAFIELADVSDLAWRTSRKKDSANHFADIDQKGKGKYGGKTLLELWRKDPMTLNPKTWVEFYDSLAPSGKAADKNCGALPFRIMEIYEAMVGAFKAKELSRFLCAAGIIAHYVADACQSLHLSHLHHGRPSHPEEADVHGYFDNNLLDRNRLELITKMSTCLDRARTVKRFRGSKEVGDAIMALAESTLTTIPPIDIINLYNSSSGSSRAKVMWNALGDSVVKVMCDGAMTLAEIWESAWIEGGGPKISLQEIGMFKQPEIRELYDDKAFLEARWLREIAGMSQPRKRTANSSSRKRRPKRIS